MNDCGCKPGTYDDGWQERRCEACVRVEMDAFGHALEWAQNGDIVKRQRGDR